MGENNDDSNLMDMRNIEKKGMGETPEDIKEKLLKLCQDYLGGVWLRQTTDSITVRRLTGGLMNQLYYCAIHDSEGKEANDSEVPEEVAVKLTQKKTFLEESESEERKRLMIEKIVTLMVSENELGAKVFGIFEGGVITKYYRVSINLAGNRSEIEEV